jgi:hypothetical protein
MQHAHMQEHEQGRVSPLSLSIADLMGWYDDLYYLNRYLTNGISSYVTTTILVACPHMIFLLQVSEGRVWLYGTHRLAHVYVLLRV